MSTSFSSNPPRKSFFSSNSFQNNSQTGPDQPKRKVLSEINPNLDNTNYQYCEKEQMFLPPPVQNKFQGFQFQPINNDWFDEPQYSPQNNIVEADDWPDFL